MNYQHLLEHSFAVERKSPFCPPKSRLEFLSEHIFDFSTYHSGMSTLFARKAVEVCAAITHRTTFDFIEDDDSHQWFLLMCNMPFFATRIDWGSSIRGAWWSTPGKLSSCGLWDEDKQLLDLPFSDDEWKDFMVAIIEFVRDEMTDNALEDNHSNADKDQGKH
jgi:hypothetical protein